MVGACRAPLWAGEHENAIRLCVQAVRLAPASAPAWGGLAWAEALAGYDLRRPNGDGQDGADHRRVVDEAAPVPEARVEVRSRMATA
jgi:hypothetical protein